MDFDFKKFTDANDIKTFAELEDFMRFNVQSAIANHNVTPDITDAQMSKIVGIFMKIFDTSMSEVERKSFQTYQSEQLSNWIRKANAKKEAELKSMDED